jgi:hypothetical protein
MTPSGAERSPYHHPIALALVASNSYIDATICTRSYTGVTKQIKEK